MKTLRFLAVLCAGFCLMTGPVLGQIPDTVWQRISFPANGTVVQRAVVNDQVFAVLESGPTDNIYILNVSGDFAYLDGQVTNFAHNIDNADTSNGRTQIATSPSNTHICFISNDAKQLSVIDVVTRDATVVSLPTTGLIRSLAVTDTNVYVGGSDGIYNATLVSPGTGSFTAISDFSFSSGIIVESPGGIDQRVIVLTQQGANPADLVALSASNLTNAEYSLTLSGNGVGLVNEGSGIYVWHSSPSHYAEQCTSSGTSFSLNWTSSTLSIGQVMPLRYLTLPTIYSDTIYVAGSGQLTSQPRVNGYGDSTADTLRQMLFGQFSRETQVFGSMVYFAQEHEFGMGSQGNVFGYTFPGPVESSASFTTGGVFLPYIYNAPSGDHMITFETWSGGQAIVLGDSPPPTTAVSGYTLYR